MSQNQVEIIRRAKQAFFDVQNDLLGSNFHNFDVNFNLFITFCETNEIMKTITEPLKNRREVDLDGWWTKIKTTGGSMVGSKRYDLPPDPDDQTALLYQFLLGISEGRYDLISFTTDVYGGRRFDSMIRDFNDDIIRRLVRNINRKLDESEISVLASQSEEEELESSVDSSAVFVVHGRNSKARDSMFSFLSSIGLKPIEWSQAIRMTGKGSPYIGEILDVAFSNAQAIVVLMTPDDEARLREEYQSDGDPDYEKNYTMQPRQNVLFEAGMAIGRNEERTILVELGSLRNFSDIYGRHTVRINNSPEKRRELASRLETAKCTVDISGIAWFTAGDFDDALP